VVLSFFYLPAQLLVGTLWRMQGSAMVIQQTGTFAFFLVPAMLLWGNGPVRMLALGLALGLWVGFAVAWRWRVYRSDLG
jgi:hypothetical protein